MEVVDRLSRRRAAVEDRSITVVESLFRSYTSSDDEQMANELLVGLGEIVETGNRLTRNDQDVRGCLGIDVVEGKAEVVIEDYFRRNLAVGYLLKKRLFAGHLTRLS